MSGNAYQIERSNKFFSAICAIAESEIRPGQTVSFLHEIDLTEVEELRSQAVFRGERRPSYTALVVKAVALALREFPYANRRVVRWSWGRRRLQQFHRCDVAVACERNLPEAPMVASLDVLRDADELSLTAITDRLRDWASGKPEANTQWQCFQSVIGGLPRWLGTLLVRLPWFVPKAWLAYRGGAALVSSPAKYGVDAVVAAWTHPLGVSFGLVKERPVVKAGLVEPCPTFVLTLNFDRRIMAGAQAARFFKRIVDLLEHAEMELASDPTRGGLTIPVGSDGDKLEKASSARSHSEAIPQVS